jgi:hypothetical protein
MKDIRRSFPPGIHERLGYYVYRLIDSRNGETFYVGKGKGDRVFQHAIGALAPVPDEDAVDTKMQRIKDIRSAGLEVGHVIHRHAIKEAETSAKFPQFPGHRCIEMGICGRRGAAANPRPIRRKACAGSIPYEGRCEPNSMHTSGLTGNQGPKSVGNLH